MEVDWNKLCRMKFYSVPMALEQQENVRFARTIKLYPCLYDFTNNRYSSRTETDAAWRAISAEFNAPVRDCKLRWKNIRTVFRRHMFGGIGPAPKKEYYLNRELRFMLPFMKVSKTHQDDTSKLEDDETEVSVMVEMETNDTESDDPSASRAPSESQILVNSLQESHPEHQEFQNDPIQRHKYPDPANEAVKSTYNYQTRLPSRSESEYGEYMQDDLATKSDEFFLLSLKDDMRRMNMTQKRKFKRRIFDIIEEVMMGDELTTDNSVNRESTNEQLAQQSIVKVEENEF